MIVVRTVFQGSYGKGGELAAAQIAAAKLYVTEMGGDRHWKVMTDLSGPFDTVVVEFEVASLAEWEGMRSRLFASAASREAIAAAMATSRALTVSGRAEHWTIEGQG
jgi:hypothetical protein